MIVGIDAMHCNNGRKLRYSIVHGPQMVFERDERVRAGVRLRGWGAVERYKVS